ncbi:MAG TPA: GvpL/GvpF family gas vesicle protein [Candidatus Limnocylindrales bacterium]
MSGAGIYVYGIVRADHPCRLGDLPGIADVLAQGRGAGVWRVAAASTAAVVSTAPAQPRAKRRDLLVHQAVLEAVWRQGPVLPMRFGTLARSEAHLRTELATSARQHREALDRVEGCGEVNVKLLPDEELLIHQVAHADSTVQRLIHGVSGNYTAKLRLGEAVATALAERTTADTGQIAGSLARFAVRTAPAPAVQGCAMNTSFLVNLRSMDGFLASAAKLEAGLGPRYRWRITGPMPPYSFTRWTE